MSPRSAGSGVDEWVVATSNAGKVREMAEILAPHPVKLLSLRDFPVVYFPEEGVDYAENARAKARVAADALGVAALADDSGIEVDALGGAPGPLSARYGGAELDDAGRVAALLDALAAVPPARRGARFVCWAALALPGGGDLVSYGECRGVVLPAPAGEGGFGYDPVFRPEGFDVSTAELDPPTKNRISHRGRAVTALYEEWRRSDRLTPGARRGTS